MDKTIKNLPLVNAASRRSFLKLTGAVGARPHSPAPLPRVAARPATTTGAGRTRHRQQGPHHRGRHLLRPLHRVRSAVLLGRHTRWPPTCTSTKASSNCTRPPASRTTPSPPQTQDGQPHHLPGDPPRRRQVPRRHPRHGRRRRLLLHPRDGPCEQVPVLPVHPLHPGRQGRWMPRRSSSP